MVRFGLVAVAGAVLAGCAATEEPGPGGPQGSYGPGYPPGSAAWSKGAKTAFRDSFMAGMADRREGFRYDEDRGAVKLDMDERYFYRMGYRRGYYHDDAVRPGSGPARPGDLPGPVSPGIPAEG